MSGVPKAEFDVTEKLVAKLVEEQCPEYAGLPVREFSSGWDNIMFRVGDNLLARMPRRQMGGDFIIHEQEWLPQLAPKLPIAVPAPLFVGQATEDYPWTWSLVPWVEGRPAAEVLPKSQYYADLPLFLKALHVKAPKNAPKNPYRGVALKLREDSLKDRFERLGDKTHYITPKIRKTWLDAIAIPTTPTSKWLHGDIHTLNIIVNREGRIASVIDWGDMCQGDVACDLACFWMLFGDNSTRQAAFDVYEASEDLIMRARGWAIFYAVIFVDTGLIDHPQMLQMGMDMFEKLENEVF